MPPPPWPPPQPRPRSPLPRRPPSPSRSEVASVLSRSETFLNCLVFLFLDETFPEKLFGRNASASAGVAVGGGAGARVCKWIGKSKELFVRHDGGEGSPSQGAEPNAAGPEDGPGDQPPSRRGLDRDGGPVSTLSCLAPQSACTSCVSGFFFFWLEGGRVLPYDDRYESYVLT